MGKLTMDASGAPLPLDAVREGLRLFNERHFFEAHEVLEEAWHRERGEPRLFLQGLIQVSAGFHHLQNGNLRGAADLLERGGEKLRRYPPGYLGIDTGRLLADVGASRDRIAKAEAGSAGLGEPAFPTIALLP